MGTSSATERWCSVPGIGRIDRIVSHVAVSNEDQEAGKWPAGMDSHVAERYYHPPLELVMMTDTGRGDASLARKLHSPGAGSSPGVSCTRLRLSTPASK